MIEIKGTICAINEFKNYMVITDEMNNYIPCTYFGSYSSFNVGSVYLFNGFIKRFKSSKNGRIIHRYKLLINEIREA